MKKLLLTLLIISFSGHLLMGQDPGYSWDRATGIEAASVHALAIDGSEKIYAGTTMSGVFSSANQAESWSGLENDLATMTVSAAATGSSNRVFAGTIDNAGTAVFASDDAGSHWTEMSTGLPVGNVTAMASDGAAHIYAGFKDGGLYHSADNGASWQQLSNGISASLDVQALHVSAAGILFVGSIEGIHRSADNGSSWSAINGSLGTPNVQSITTNSRGEIYIATSIDVYSSNDSGMNWTALAFQSTSGGKSALLVLTSGDLLVGTVADGLWKKDANSANWMQVQEPRGRVNCLIDAGNNTIYSGTTGLGVYKSGDGGNTWERKMSGFEAATVTAIGEMDATANIANNPNVIAIAQNDKYHYAAVLGGLLYFSSDFGRTFFACTSNGLKGQDIKKIVCIAQTIYVLTYFGAIYTSTDFGNNFLPFMLGMAVGAFVNDICKGPDVLLMAATTVGIFRIMAATLPWELVFAQPAVALLYSAIMQHYIISTTTLGIIMAAFIPHFVYEQINNGLPNNNTHILATNPIFPAFAILAILYNSGYEAWGRQNGFTGTFWNISGLPLLAYIVAAQWITGPQFYAIFTRSNGIYSVGGEASTSMKLAWNFLQYLYIRTALAVAYGEGNPFLMLGLVGHGLYTLNESPSAVELSDNSIPESVQLAQNYPNPFNPTTTIQFHLPTTLKTKLEIFNTLGQRVRTLVDATLNAGQHKFNWNAANQKSGIYYYRLSTSQSVQVRSLAFVK
ncbi:MAG: T9SS C-terminal target domain-containing protein [Calditrichaeota bacterium]|nr:MAG: T9SS C-terminal target domain-containing protein [Calditrichota bacterium]